MFTASSDLLDSGISSNPPDNKITSDPFNVTTSSNPLDISIIAAAIVAPLVCVTVVILLLRKLHVESYKRFRFHLFDRDEWAGEEMTYDVFILYAHEDKQLAREILEFLENNGCKVRFHQRDFVAGESVFYNIIEAVYKSKRVLCLVTPNFLQNRYCLDEYNIAYTHNVELQKHRLIIVKDEQFNNGAQLDAGAYEGKKTKLSKGNLHFIQPNKISHAEDSAFVDKVFVLRDVVTRHTFINLSVADSWRDQLLCAMPIHRLGAEPSRVKDTPECI